MKVVIKTDSEIQIMTEGGKRLVEVLAKVKSKIKTRFEI